MNDLYTFLENYLESSFEEMSVLKETPRGSVRRVRHKTSHRNYICRSFAGSDLVYRKLLGVKCEHLPRIYEAAGDGERVLVLEEFILGDTLAALLQAGPLSVKETRNIALQVCEALYTLHSLGLVHRDIKPDNVLVLGSTAYLIDFNASREIGPDKIKDTQILGTRGYAPPEQYGISQTDEHADIYAMGVLMNEMLTGQHPSQTLAKGRWGRIISKCTMIQPDKRYSSVRELMEIL